MSAERQVWTYGPRRGHEGRQGGPRPETEHSDAHRARAEAKRARRRERRLHVDAGGYR